MKVKSLSRVRPTLSDPMDCSQPGFSVHGIFQAEYWSGVPLPYMQNFCLQLQNANFPFWDNCFLSEGCVQLSAHMQYRDDSYLLNFLTFTHLLSMSLSSVASLILGTCRYSINILLEYDWNSWYTLVIHTRCSSRKCEGFLKFFVYTNIYAVLTLHSENDENK